MAVLLIAHGSPDPRHRQAIGDLAALVEGAVGGPVQVGYLDHDAPSVNDAIDAFGDRRDQEPIAAVGLLLSDGYHARIDVPEALTSASDSVVNCGTLGLGDWLIPALERSLRGVVGGNAPSAGVVLVASGSSRPEARDEVVALAGRWQQQRGAPVRAAFATGPGPSIAETVSMLHDASVMRPVLIPLLLAPGSMTDRVEELAAGYGAPIGRSLLDPANSEPPAELVSRIAEVVGRSRGA